MASLQQMNPDDGSRDDSAPLPSLFQRYRLLAIAIALGIVCTTGGLTALWFVWNASVSSRPRDLDAALAALDTGEDATAARIASQYKSLADWSRADLAKVAYVLGVTTYRQAERSIGPEAAYRYLAASRLLEEAADYGWPEGRAAEGWFLLGESLFACGQYPAARLNLRRAAELKQPRRRGQEIRRLLAAAYMKDDPPELEKAFQENEKFLESGSLSRLETTKGLLQRAEILLGMGRLEEAAETLARIDKDAPLQTKARIIQGRLLMEEGKRAQASDADSAKARFEKAIALFRDAQAFDADGDDASEAAYYIGLCLEAMGDYAAALAQFERTEDTFSRSAEALPAALRRANLACQLGKTKLVLPACKKIVEHYEKTRFSANRGAAHASLVESARNLIGHYADAGEYPLAERIARLFAPILGEKESLRLRIDCTIRHGEAFFDQAKGDPTEASAGLMRKGRTCMRTAGVLLAKLAALEFESPEYPELVWRSAESYFRGRDYEESLKMAQEFLSQRTKTGRPEALVLSAKALLALGKPDEAIALVDECLAFDGKNAVAYQARLVASECYLETGDYDKAERMLAQNIEGDLLSPESGEWRESLFRLGELLLQQGKIEDAIVRLKEAVNRYPDAPETAQGYYALARAEHALSRERVAALRRDWGETIDVFKTPQVREPLSNALNAYEETRGRLASDQETGFVDQSRRSLLANTLFAIADVQFDLGDYAAAAQSYAVVTNRYQNRPEVLEAYIQLSRAYRGMGKPRSAVAVLEQAKIVLGRMQGDVDLKATTLYDRAEWENRLDSEINQPPYFATIP